MRPYGKPMSRDARSRSRLLTDKAPRVDVYEGKECAEPGCDRVCRAMSRWCTRHAMRHFRTRNPNGRLPRVSELRPWRQRVDYALTSYRLEEHPALLAAEQTLEGMIARHATFPKPHGDHFRRLFQNGATGREMLARILTIYGWGWIGLPNREHVDDAVFFCALGSHFLRAVPVGWRWTSTGKREQVRLPGLMCETLGYALAEKVGALALGFWRREEAEYQGRGRDQADIRQALKDNPL